MGLPVIKAIPHNSRLTAQAPLRRLRHGICVAKMLDNVGLRYPHRASGAKAPRTLRPLPLLRFAVSATGGAHLCSIQCYLRFWLSSCRTSLAVSALRIMRYCLKMISNDGARGLDTMCAPNGKNYIAHDDIPPEVQAAFERLQAVYGTQTRAANPLYASK